LRSLLWVVTLLVLAPIWLVQRDIWDGVIGAYGLERHDFSGIYHWLVPSNWGLLYLMLRGIEFLSAATAVPPWIWVKLILCASLIALAREARLLCDRVLGWSERDSRFAELVALCFPCWYLLYGSTFIYLVFIWCGFAGHRLMHEGAGALRRAAGYALVLLSFQVNSNFVMICALEGMRWIHRGNNQAWRWGRTALVVGSAVAAYLSLRLIWTPTGPYVGYNNLVWPFSRQGMLTWIRAAAMALTWIPLVVAPAAVAWLAVRRTESQVGAAPQDRFIPREAATVGLLLAGALFAYLAVGKGAPLFVLQLPEGWLGTGTHLGKVARGWLYTTADGWSMRNAFLLSVPAAIAIVWLVRVALAGRQRQDAGWRAALAAALIVNLAWLAEGHATKLLRFAQEKAIVRALQAQAPPASGTVDLKVIDPVAWTAWSYEANYLFWLAYRRPEWAAAIFGPDDLSRRAALEERSLALSSPLPRIHFLMDQLGTADCHTEYAVDLPAHLGPLDVVADNVGLREVPPAGLRLVETNCPRP
jgi:hypothetical protein